MAVGGERQPSADEEGWVLVPREDAREDAPSVVPPAPHPPSSVEAPGPPPCAPAAGETGASGSGRTPAPGADGTVAGGARGDAAAVDGRAWASRVPPPAARRSPPPTPSGIARAVHVGRGDDSDSDDSDEGGDEEESWLAMAGAALFARAQPSPDDDPQPQPGAGAPPPPPPPLRPDEAPLPLDAWIESLGTFVETQFEERAGRLLGRVRSLFALGSAAAAAGLVKAGAGGGAAAKVEP